MLEGFYTAASGVLMQERTLNVIANNIANVKTAGFRAERVISTTFEQTLLTCRENGTDRMIGKGAPVRLVEDVPTTFEESLLEETNRPFDLALVGKGFFNVQSAEGEIYLTRNGNFDVDDDGFLILRGVGQVLGQKGPVEIGLSDSFIVDEDGTIRDKDNKVIDRLLITDPQENPDAATTAEAAQSPMKKFTNGLYTATDPEMNLPLEGVSIQQNHLERSNLNLNREYTLVMETQRAFQSCSAALKMIDEINGKAASQIASIG